MIKIDEDIIYFTVDIQRLVTAFRYHLSSRHKRETISKIGTHNFVRTLCAVFKFVIPSCRQTRRDVIVVL